MLRLLRLPRILTRRSSTLKANNPYIAHSMQSPSRISNAAPSSSGPHKPIVWIDCEMTGLNPAQDQIIEVCCIVTDGHLNTLDDGYESVVHCDKQVMDKMDEWCTEHHGSSGLTAKVIASDKTPSEVEEELLAYIKKHIPESNVGVLAGNSVHMDRLFMMKDFPRVVDHLFYRIIDVSSIREVCYRHNSQLLKVMPRKKLAHTAKSDILESIAQLKWFQNYYLKSEAETRALVKSIQASDAASSADSNADSTAASTADSTAATG
ncbi:HDL530Wp [Eremothecium sinecaudum]|uniref:HDL530Wp n=1 Tax=Eremothecium sinecaudum TaxID=45286 RepID=A0A0X8HRQ5_9SACH|nr:HDL530Wp [Eremothecium sinecaudum]AMD20214.1 HDL530Wp [Eremothecium sinecaudum]